MKATTTSTSVEVTRRVSLADAQPIQSKRYPGKLWRPTSAVVEYRLFGWSGWEAVTVTLYGNVLRLNGELSVRRHPGEIQHAWGANAELTRLVGVLRPRDGHGPVLTGLSEFDLSGVEA